MINPNQPMEELDLVKLNYSDVHPYANSLDSNKRYLVNCDFYEKKVLMIHTARFDRTTITGTIKNMNVLMHCVTTNYDNVTFENCIFNDKSWFDWINFDNCKFINCKFGGSMRWIDFNNCQFINVEFDMEYTRRVTIKKNCQSENINIKIKQIDEYIWLFGKRYSESYHPFHDAVLLQMN